MKKINVLLLIMLVSFSVSATALGTWTEKASFTVARSTHAAFSINGKGYICAGANSNGGQLNDLWEYDLAADSWTRKADFPGGGRQELTCFVIGNYAYVGLGRNVNLSTDYASFYRYDPSNNTWTGIADCPVKRYTAGGFSIDSIGYITCGIEVWGDRHKDLWAYNPRTNSWSQKTSLPSGAINRAFPCVGSVNHKGYLMGGYDGNSIGDDFYEYDPIADTWTNKKKYPITPRSYASCFSIGRYILIGGGRQIGNVDPQDWHYYDPTNNTWTRVADQPELNAIGTGSFSMNGNGYVSGGFDIAGNTYNLFHEFSEASLGIKPISENIGQINSLNPYFAIESNSLHCNTYGGELKVTIYDLNGNVISFSDLKESNNEIVFDLSFLIEGYYVAYFSNGNLNKSIKFVVR